MSETQKEEFIPKNCFHLFIHAYPDLYNFNTNLFELEYRSLMDKVRLQVKDKKMIEIVEAEHQKHYEIIARPDIQGLFKFYDLPIKGLAILNANAAAWRNAGINPTEKDLGGIQFKWFDFFKQRFFLKPLTKLIETRVISQQKT